MGSYVAQVAPHGGILPSQIQRLTADVLNLPYEQVSDEWTKQPMAMTLAGLGGSAPVNPTDYPLPSAAAQQDVTLGERLRRVETRMAQIVTDELRAAGLDYQVQARLLDLPTGERLP